MSRCDSAHRERRTNSRKSRLSEYFVEGEGINREVIQKEVCNYLGLEAYARPHAYNGVEGYLVTAVRPFTPDMLDELMELSKKYETESRDRRQRNLAALYYEDSEACRREETVFAVSGTEYTSMRGSSQPQVSYPTASPLPRYPTTSPLPGYPPRYGLISDQEGSDYAGYPAYPYLAGVGRQYDLNRDSDSSRALSWSARTNGLDRTQNDPQGIDHPLSPESQDRQDPYGSRNSRSSDFTAVYRSPQHTSSPTDAYTGQFTGPNLCFSCAYQASKSPSITLCSACRAKVAPILDSCDKNSSYNSAVALVASLLVGVVAGGLMAAEYAARNIVDSLRR